MKLFTARGFCGFAVLAIASLSLMAATPANETAKIVSTANTFLASLDAGQRRSVMYAFDDKQPAWKSMLAVTFHSWNPSNRRGSSGAIDARRDSIISD